MPAPAPAHGSIQFAGREYIRVTDWAHGRALAPAWAKRDEILDLTKTGLRIRLVADSREVRINGIQVWLLHPALARNGSIYIARQDARATLDPIIWPSRSPAGQKVRMVCLDPGHGGQDPGNQAGGRQEKSYTLLLAADVREELKRAGLRSTMTRYGDSFVALDDRPAAARIRKADLFVSLHFNSAENGRGTVKGSEVYCLTPAGAASTNSRGETGDAARCPANRFDDQSMLLAYHVQKALTRGLLTEDRGVRRARFAVLRNAPAPAILVEAGFMSHPTEGKKIFTTDYRRRIARAIVQGIVAYTQAVERD